MFAPEELDQAAKIRQPADRDDGRNDGKAPARDHEAELPETPPSYTGVHNASSPAPFERRGQEHRGRVEDGGPRRTRRGCAPPPPRGPNNSVGMPNSRCIRKASQGYGVAVTLPACRERRPPRRSHTEPMDRSGGRLWPNNGGSKSGCHEGRCVPKNGSCAQNSSNEARTSARIRAMSSCGRNWK